MYELDKQREQQQEKKYKKEVSKAQKRQSVKRYDETRKAGASTDPQAMKDPSYVKRMEEKTGKH